MWISGEWRNDGGDTSSAQTHALSLSQAARLHVVGHVDGVQLVLEEAVTEVHALLLTTGVDGDDADVRHHDDAHDQVVLLQHGLGHHRNQVQGFLLRALQLHHHHQQVGPGEDGADGETDTGLGRAEVAAWGKKKAKL